ncbi:MAG: hypothetical protein U5K54_00790 [Cytophagales bacterium]|nr:hypothetical protein [Cytophagales bacterium]
MLPSLTGVRFVQSHALSLQAQRHGRFKSAIGRSEARAGANQIVIVTDGAFSMGMVPLLNWIRFVILAEQYEALVMTDECHYPVDLSARLVVVCQSIAV